MVPAYNEADRLPRTLLRLDEYYRSQPYAWEVTVVSDGSSDATERVVEEFAASHPGFSLLAYSPNRGKGHAVRVGMLRATGERVLFCDADLATPQEETEKLMAHLDAGADVAIGSRPLAESRLEVRQPWYRELLGRLFNQAVQLLAVRGIDDTQCGFKLFTREAAQATFRRCALDGFSFDLAAIMVARDLGLRIDEVPVRWRHQEGSKVVLLRDGPRMLKDLVGLRLKGKKIRMEFKDREALG